MLCDICRRNEAILSYTEIIGGVKREMHLCRECAAGRTNKAFESLTSPSSILSNLLASMLGESPDSKDPEEDLSKTNVVCPICGMTYNEFMKNGYFGCPECYRTFNFLIDGYFKKIHGNAQHTGRHPISHGETFHIESPEEASAVKEGGEDSGSGNDPNKIVYTIDEGSTEDELRAAIKRAVAREEYEEAARLRDIIRSMKEGGVNE
ncbi:MAG: UvrB/UvrC motif-containing protein [Lachnospiraceae bacterium]|nr:UvrB/UvrC motif-containing protein [Lachnospiraceae bacterium]